MNYLFPPGNATAVSVLQVPDRPEPTPVKIIKAHSLAHLDQPAWLRGRQGADWMDGRALLIPTVKLAAEIFGVSPQLIVRERGPFPRALGLLTYGWLKCSERERAAFCAEYEADVWHSLEHVTDQG